MNRIDVRNLSCGYEGKPVLHGIGLAVPEGGFFGIIGPNGSGKTTLFRAVTGLLRPDAGEILLDGVDVRRMSRPERARRVSVVPQIADIPFAFTVRELVSLGRYPHLGRFRAFGPADVAVVNHALRLVEVDHLADRRVNHLSAGEKQRVFLAQALAQEPRTLLLDEPISHLDIRHQVEMLDLLRRLNREGLTIVVILHDLNLAAEYCGALALFSNGRVAACGAPEAVLDYRLIEQVYRTVVIIRENPLSKKPYVLLVSGDALQAHENKGEPSA